MTQESINLIPRIFVNSRIRIIAKNNMRLASYGTMRIIKMIPLLIFFKSKGLYDTDVRLLVLKPEREQKKIYCNPFIVGSWVAANSSSLFLLPFILICCCSELITRAFRWHLASFSRFSIFCFKWFLRSGTLICLSSHRRKLWLK